MYSNEDLEIKCKSNKPEEPNLPGSGKTGGEVGGSILSVTGLNHFYYVRDFTDMRCKHGRVLSIIRIDWKDVVLLLENRKRPILTLLSN